MFAVSVSLAVLVVLIEPTNSGPETLEYRPATGAVTFTDTLQVLFAARVPLLNETEPEPAIAVKVGVPHPLVVAPGVAATCIAPGDVGNVSVKLTPVTAAAFGFEMVNVRTETPDVDVGSGLNCLENVSAFGSMMFRIRLPTP